MMICDTTNVNSGRKNGIVIQLKREFVRRGYDEPQYIGCQHHVLDLILKHIMDNKFDNKTTSPDINYSFIDNIKKDYQTLKKVFKGRMWIKTTTENYLAWWYAFSLSTGLCVQILQGKWRISKNTFSVATFLTCS